MNPIEMVKSFMSSGGNPQQLINKVMNMAGNKNPMFNNLLQMANKGDAKAVEQFARNYIQGIGMDFDTEFGNFMKNFK